MQNNKKKKKFTRYTALVVCTVFIISIISIRLAYLQIVKADEFKVRADKNYIRNISTSAPRGDIVDKNGVVLATSRQSFNLTYMDTKENRASFFNTMRTVFKILKENGEVEVDDFPLKINPYRFEFNAVKDSDKKWLELRFKTDRGLADEVAKKKYKKKYSEILEEQDKEKIKYIQDQLLKITPKETFDFLLNEYGIVRTSGKKTKYDCNFKLNLDQQRQYMIVKDAIKIQSFSGYKPVTISKNIKRETAFKFYERLSELPGINIGNEPIRYYPYGELASSVLGYISKINSVDKDSYVEKGYDVSTDYIGVDGIEKVFENRLRGSKGQQTVKVNKLGRIVEELFKKEPYPGQNIQLTIDAKLQNAAEKALDDTMKHLRENPRPDSTDSTIYTANATRGAAVAVDVKTGKILALASRPGFDPNIFTIPGKLSSSASKKYFSPNLKEFGENYIRRMGLASGKEGVEAKLNQMFPIDKSIKGNTTIREDRYDIVPKSFYNYATCTLSPPGSTFKPITAIAGMQDGVINTNTVIVDNGTYSNFGGVWHCWKAGGHGPIEVVRALKESCNVFFYTVGGLLYNKYKDISQTKAFDILGDYANKFGLGCYTGIEIPEKKGQAYNLKKSVKVRGQMSYYAAVAILKSGYEKSKNTKFEPIDVVIREKTENKNVTSIKKAIKDTLIKAITVDVSAKQKGKYYEKYAEELQQNLRKLIDTYDKDKQSKYTDEDLEKTSYALMNYCIWDANTQIYTPGNIINAAIGQGDHNFTPIQLANYAATLANGGHRYSLHLLDRIYDDDGKTVEEKKSKIAQEINLKESTKRAVKEGMKAVTEGGTATNAFNGFPIETAGKTGSATYSAIQNEFGRTSYGVYVGYAPADNPEIAVSVVIFDGGHGGYVAPVARAIYEQYFSDVLKKEYPGYRPRYNYPLELDKQDINIISDMGDENDDEKSKSNEAVDNEVKQDDENVKKQNNHYKKDIKIYPKDVQENKKYRYNHKTRRKTRSR